MTNQIKTKRNRKSTREVVERAIELSKITEGTWDELVHGIKTIKPDTADENMTAESFKIVLERVSRPLKRKKVRPDLETK